MPLWSTPSPLCAAQTCSAGCPLPQSPKLSLSLSLSIYIYIYIYIHICQSKLVSHPSTLTLSSSRLLVMPPSPDHPREISRFHWLLWPPKHVLIASSSSLLPLPMSGLYYVFLKYCQSPNEFSVAKLVPFHTSLYSSFISVHLSMPRPTPNPSLPLDCFIRHVGSCDVSPATFPAKWNLMS